MAKSYKKEIDVFPTHQNEAGENVLYNGQKRLQQLLGFLGTNINALTVSMGWERPDRMYRVKDGITKEISAGLALEIHKAFPKVSLYWLITGDGDIERGIGLSDGQAGNAGGVNSGEGGVNSSGARGDLKESLSQLSKDLAAMSDRLKGFASKMPGAYLEALDTSADGETREMIANDKRAKKDRRGTD